MSKEMICCPFCGEELEPVYRQAGVRVEIAYHLCKKCNKRAEIEIWQALIQSQRDLNCAKQALEDIKKVCEGCRWCDSNLYDPTPHDGRRIAETTNKAIAQITHDNN